MKGTKHKETYTSPQVKVVEIKARQIICQSGGTPTITNDNDPYGF